LVVLAAESYLETEKSRFAGIPRARSLRYRRHGVLASAQELLTAFIGLEMSSISSYILAGYRRDALKSSESALKYFCSARLPRPFFSSASRSFTAQQAPQH